MPIKGKKLSRISFTPISYPVILKSLLYTYSHFYSRPKKIMFTRQSLVTALIQLDRLHFLSPN